MKVYCESYNSLLDLVIEQLKKDGLHTDKPHEADVLLTWQDVRGDCKELAEIFKLQGKPVIVVQHGRGAVRDYGPPNNFKLIADKICVWGQTEVERLLRYGIPKDKIEVVGCPLFPRFLGRKKDKRHGKNILFAPVIAEKEEPENILVFSWLKKWESEQLCGMVQEDFKELKKAWANEHTDYRDVVLPDGKVERRVWKKEVQRSLPRFLTYRRGLLNVLTTPLHDTFQYMAPMAVVGQDSPDGINSILEMLSNTDVVVCLEEGTLPLLACAWDVPVIVVDIYKYGTYGGTEGYDKIEKIRTNACHYITRPERLGRLVQEVLAHPALLQKERMEMVQREAEPQIAFNATANIIKVVQSFAPVRERLLVSA